MLQKISNEDKALILFKLKKWSIESFADLKVGESIELDEEVTLHCRLIVKGGTESPCKRCYMAPVRTSAYCLYFKACMGRWRKDHCSVRFTQDDI